MEQGIPLQSHRDGTKISHYSRFAPLAILNNMDMIFACFHFECFSWSVCIVVSCMLAASL